MNSRNVQVIAKIKLKVNIKFRAFEMTNLIAVSANDVEILKEAKSSSLNIDISYIFRIQV